MYLCTLKRPRGYRAQGKRLTKLPQSWVSCWTFEAWADARRFYSPRAFPFAESMVGEVVKAGQCD
jgi:hypothetical protein